VLGALLPRPPPLPQVGGFIVSCINTFAQSYRAELDEQEVQERAAAKKQQ
jgi:hypothetical protein